LAEKEVNMDKGERMRRREVHLMPGSLLIGLNAGPGSAAAVAARMRERTKDFILEIDGP